MATLQQKIMDKFIEKLSSSKDVDAEKIKQLKILLSNGKKPKTDDFIKIFSLPAGGNFE